MATFPPVMTAADALLWNIEHDPVLRTTITVVALLDRSPDWERLLAKLERGTRDVPRLRQKVVEPPLRLGPPEWVEDAGFDLGYHVRRMRAPGAGTLRDVLDVAEPLSMAGFDRTRPLWELTLVEGLEDGRAAIIQKLHHAIADGVGGVAVAMMLLDLTPDAALPPLAPASARPADVGVARLARRALTRRARGAARRAAGLPGLVERTTATALREPVESARWTAGLAGSIARMLAPAGAPRSPLLVGRTLGRSFNVIEVPLDRLRAASHHVGCTLNAAFLAAAVGGTSRYHDKHGGSVDALRVNMPVNVRGRDDELGGNRFVPTRFLLPAGIHDPAERMRTLGAIADRWRSEPALGISDALAAILNALPPVVTTGIFGSMLKGVDLTVTNIPGISVPVWIGGAEVERIFALGPPSGSAVSIALLSHRDTACVGVVCDTGAVEDVGGFVSCVVDAFDEVAAVGDQRGDATSTGMTRSVRSW